MREFYVPEVDESLYGTWVNPGYELPGCAARLTIHPWGLVEWFACVADTAPSRIGTSLIVERWTDEGGNTFYREYRQVRAQESEGGYAFVLARVSRDEQRLEFVVGAYGWPTQAEIDPGLNPTYATYRRAE
ncbi:MAG: hypothetical protein JW820_16360 [Spirochaetales bacterium]|nr:hypothetical protein [Spirochaetales bacterium]